MKRSAALLLAALAILSSGCAAVRKVTAPDDENLLSGAGSIVSASRDSRAATTEAFEQLDLDVLLRQYGLHDPAAVATGSASAPEHYKYLRNDLQERLINASNQRCASYVRMLVTSKAQTQMGWTSLATLLSGAASVIAHPVTAQAFAAGSTVSTGLLSTYNEAYFSNLTVTVISAGIAKRRESILASISGYKTKTLGQYPVQAAIADALVYHGACNVVAGMESAARATNEANPKTFAPLSR